MATQADELEEGHEHGPECGCPGQEMEEGWGYRDDEEDDNPTRRPTRRHDNPIKALSAKDYEGIGSKERGDEEGNRPSMASKMGLKRENTSGKISVREAKEITRRIIERIKKEGK